MLGHVESTGGTVSSSAVEQSDDNCETQRQKHVRRTRGRPRVLKDEGNGRSDNLPTPSKIFIPHGSSQDNAVSDVISDQTLMSLEDEDLPQSSVGYEQLLRKALSLLKKKNERDEIITGLRARNESLQQLNKTIKEKSVRLHARAEQEEEFISNMLLKRIQKLKNDKEALALKYEQEEEFLTNDLTRKLSQLQSERDELAGQIEAEQNWVVDTLLVKIRKLEAEINANHLALEQLRRDKVDLENALEHEQESLFNTLGKRMDQLEAEKRRMQARLDQSSIAEEQSSASSLTDSLHESEFTTPTARTSERNERRSTLAETEARKSKEECSRLRNVICTLKVTVSNLQKQISVRETKYVAELLSMFEKSAGLRAENRRGRSALEADLIRCLETCRTLASSESTREMEEDRRMNELLNKMSVPKSITPTLSVASPRCSISSIGDTDAVPWQEEQTTPAELQGEVMEEGSEAAETDGEGLMDANFGSLESSSPLQSLAADISDTASR